MIQMIFELTAVVFVSLLIYAFGVYRRAKRIEHMTVEDMARALSRMEISPHEIPDECKEAVERVIRTPPPFFGHSRII